MASLLTVNGIHVYYGSSHILHDVSFSVERGEVVGLLGRNGVGKTTALQSILGIPAPRRGAIIFNGERISGRPITSVVRSGIAWVPQGHRIFTTLSVRENIALAGVHARKGPWTTEGVLDLFPSLRERLDARGGTLSGGEQQMLAIARALVQNPELILMDEPSEGLSPLLVSEVGAVIARLNAEGCSILLVEQNLSFATRLASTICVMNKGAIACAGSTAEVQRDPSFSKYLGVSATGTVTGRAGH